MEKGYEVTTVTRKPFKIGKNILLSVENIKDLTDHIKSENYDAIINCIGILNTNAENNPSNAVLINSYLPHLISDIVKNTETKMIQMSTDCVFSGETGGYNENSLPDGSTFYDRTKALGEVVNEKDLTFRNSIIGPDMNKDGIGLFNWFMRQDGSSIKGFDKAMWNGVTTLTLAKAMEKSIQENLIGLYHLASEPISKYELLKIFNVVFKNEKHKIVPYSDFVINKTLVNTRSDFCFSIPSHQTMVEEMYNWIQLHKEYYKHYFTKGVLDIEKIKSNDDCGNTSRNYSVK